MRWNSDIRMKLVLGSLEKLILHLSSRTFVGGLGMDKKDLAQEGRLKVINTFNKYSDKPTGDIIRACYTSLSNLYNGFIRRSHFKKNTGIVVDLTEAFSKSDPNQIAELYINLALNHLRSMLDKDQRIVLDKLLEVEGTEIMKRKAILESVDLSRKEISGIIEYIRNHIPTLSYLEFNTTI